MENQQDLIEEQQSFTENTIQVVGSYDDIKIKAGKVKLTVEFDLQKNAHLLEKLSNEAGSTVALGIAFQQQEMTV